jgi:hypothetical protein
VTTKPEDFTAEDEALLDRLAARVVELRMEVPAVLALESVRPLTFLTSQTMVFFEPIARALFRLPDYRHLTALVERRDAPEKLVAKIEKLADETRRARKASAQEERRAREAAAGERRRARGAAPRGGSSDPRPPQR